MDSASVSSSVGSALTSSTVSQAVAVQAVNGASEQLEAVMATLLAGISAALEGKGGNLNIVA